MQAKMGDGSSAIGATLAHCRDVQTRPNNYRDGVYKGYAWGYAAASCGIAYQLTKDNGHAQAGVRMMKALLDDRNTEGDRNGGDDVIQQDTGYAVRFHPPFVAIAYDMLKGSAALDAATEQLARNRMKTWIDWYTAQGYLKDQYGSNYHAGYVFAKTMVAAALAGEEPKAAAYWADVVDKIFAVDIVDKGLKRRGGDNGKVPGSFGGMGGGEWPEGWDYANQSVLMYAASARVLADNNVRFPELDEWFGDMPIHHAYALVPDKKGLWLAGDIGDKNAVNAPPSIRAYLGMMIGPGNDQRASIAKRAYDEFFPGKRDECPSFDALAEARGLAGGDFMALNPPRFYVARGTRTLFARSSWDDKAMWAVFQSSPHLVPDHQHLDASNFGFSRGPDHLIVDSSPYGSLSTVTSNAITVDSASVQQNYRPSQSPFGLAELLWVRGFESGTAAARGDIAAAFRWDDKPSDVPFARRDFVFFPEGEVVLVDRVRTDDPARQTRLRFRSLATLTYADPVAKGTVGGSQVAIHKVSLSGGAPSVRTPSTAECSGSNFGQCTSSRFATTEYGVSMPGPTATALHVIDATAVGEPVPAVNALGDPGILGTEIVRGAVRLLVAASSAKDGAAPGEMKYGAPGDLASRHVVFDAPEDANGRSKVTARAEGGKCLVSIVAGEGFEGRPLAFSMTNAGEGCRVTEDKGVKPLIDPGKPYVPGGPGGGGNGGGPNDPNGANDPASSGCACTAPAARAEAMAWMLGVALVLGAFKRRARSQK
jgi:hypothetical protein